MERNARRNHFRQAFKKRQVDLSPIPRKIISFLIGNFLFSGIPLLAWGVRHLPGYFQNRARLGYFFMMIVLTALAVLFVPDEGRGSGKGEKPLKRQKLTIVFLQVSSITILSAAPYCDRHALGVIGDSDVLRTLGLFLALTGYVLMNVAVITLGRQFSVEVTVQKNHQLITGGIYHFIRHPRYLGIILFMAGISSVFRSWAAVFLSVLTAAVLIWRIRDEEKLMHQEFTKDWEEYKRNSWRLIPYLY
jgi:protein-S-isoprenylcysteine O-methyltransferase Ste14